uniref:PXCC family protein n=1 Tax=Scytodes thoracica TaxID=1112478 RepID=A0A0A0V9T5_SCYTH|nr:PXCC family protein [Scytodes thoracica]
MALKITNLVVLALGLLHVCCAFSGMEGNEVYGDCIYEGKEMKEDDMYFPEGKCMQIICREKYYSINGCEVHRKKKGCEKVNDPSKPYPGCCPKLQCSDD